MPASSLLASLLFLSIAGFSQASALKPTQEGLAYGKAGNQSLKMDYYAGSGAGARPIAMLIHASTAHQDWGADLLAGAGYDVFSLTYQEPQQHPLDDVERAIRYVRFHAREWNGDARKVVVIGDSEGGYLSTMVGLINASGVMGSDDTVDRESARVQAVVAIFGVCESVASSRDASMRALLDPLLAEQDEEAALARSSPTYVNPDAPPFLLLYGDKAGPSAELPEALRKVGMRCDVIRVQNGTSPTTPQWEHDMAHWLYKTLAHSALGEI